jgi:hypothetical protein
LRVNPAKFSVNCRDRPNQRDRDRGLKTS